MTPTKALKKFIESENSGILLIICTIISILLANSAAGDSYIGFWHLSIGFLNIETWINDGLMAIFFFMVGLELKRELLAGELSTARKAVLPVFAAFGGMIVPGFIYLLLNYGTDTQHGFGIPMATDIAFAIGILSLLGKRVPVSLKVFLTAVAVIDDFGAILIIAFFYSSGVSWHHLGVVALIFLVLVIFNRLKVKSAIPYLIGGVVMWYFMLQTGVHATIAGILLSAVIPFGKGSDRALSYRLENWLHKPVAFVILPVFALANTAIVFGSEWAGGLLRVSSLGIIIGLFIGKPIGILLLSYITHRFGITDLPKGLKWKEMLGAGMLAGIGFTMSIFIALLAFDSAFLITESKISILFGSLISAIVGTLYLHSILKKPPILSQEK